MDIRYKNFYKCIIEKIIKIPHNMSPVHLDTMFFTINYLVLYYLSDFLMIQIYTANI